MILLFNKMNLQYYKCEICDKVFVYNSELIHHMEHFHLVEPYPNNTALWRVGPKFGIAIPSFCSESCKWLHSHPYAAVFTEILKGLKSVLKDDVITKILEENGFKRVEEWWKKKSHQEEDNEFHTDIDVSNGACPPKKKRKISGLLKEAHGEYRMRTTLPTTIIDLCDSENEENDYQELEYVDEEGNPVSIRENNSELYEVANIEPDKLSNPANEDVLELDLDAELDGFQETSDLLTESPTPSKTFSTERHRKENLISLTSRKEQERPPPRLRKESRSSPEDYDKSNKDVSFSNQSHAPKIESRDSFGNDLEYDEEREDESIADDHRKRFKSERSSITLTPAKSRTAISDTLESVISIEKTAKVQAFLENEQKRKMRFKAKMQRRMEQPPRFQRPNQIFNVTQEQPTKQLSYYSLDGHSKPKTSCCGTENKEIVSCSLDGSVNLWKVPVEVSDAHFTPESSVTGLILSASSDFALSSDGHGNLIIWKIDVESPTSPLTYAGKKKYDQGFITGLLWLKCKKFACAVIELVESGERSILDIIEFNDSPQKMPLSLELKKSYTFECEISCLDTCDQTDTILVGMKSGEVMYITPEAEHCYKMSNNLILCLSFYSKYKTSDHFYVSYVDGRVKMYSVQNLLSGKETINPEPLPLKTYEPPDSSDSSEFISVMCCAKNSIICGGSDGVLRIYDQSSLKFTKKIHDLLISGMSVIGSYLFTSSLDKTVKGWNLTSFKQVCEFDSAAPVSCLSSIKTDSKVSIQESNILVCGTTSGHFYIFQLTG